MMQIIEEEVLDDATFDKVCDAGQELHQMMEKFLAERGLTGQIANVVLIAAAGAILESEMPMMTFVESMGMASQMWTTDEERRVKFDPPHRRDGFVPAASAGEGNGN